MDVHAGTRLLPLVIDAPWPMLALKEVISGMQHTTAASTVRVFIGVTAWQ
jgi:hypothetical protein